MGRMNQISWEFQFLSALFLVLLAVVPNGCSPGTISCFVCSSRNSSYKECEDPFNAGVSTYVDRCKVPRRGHVGEFPAHFCIKIIGVSYTTHEKIVIRRCTSETMDKQCGQFRLGDDLLRGCILTCDLDGCNPANNPQQSYPLILTMLGLFIVVWTSMSMVPTSSVSSLKSLSHSLITAEQILVGPRGVCGMSNIVQTRPKLQQLLRDDREMQVQGCC